MTGEEIALELISILQVNYGINSIKLLVCTHDQLATNGAAMQTIKVVFPNLINSSNTGRSNFSPTTVSVACENNNQYPKP